MQWIRDIIANRETEAENRRYQREQDEKFFKDMGKNIASFADDISTLFIKDTFQDATAEQAVPIAALQESLKSLARESLLKFLGEDKFGRELALKTHIAPHKVDNAELVSLVRVIEERFNAVGDSRFAAKIPLRDVIDRFDNYVQGRIQIMSYEMQSRHEPDAHSMGM